ncbi:H-NS family nucleoid-associated regulatory protein [Mesorhizobium sp. ES1-1]|uniref:H-NS histone family protein n=1 Tax=Mesorhizobium sp. ES1-1 TaxID=2876629 RepID=UPI001CCBBEAF|nr:H-NS family nucleoid-associated regulatory protein [Mesorhizobium sp. ES1-1]MBZ9674511.1 H-NS histone family protein [Mesorhizobium sp. ES1-1]
MAKLPFFGKNNLPDLGSLSLEELTALHTHVGKHLVDRKEARIKELQAELKSLGAATNSTFVGNGKPSGPRVGNGKKAGGEIGNANTAGGVDSGGKERAKPPVTHRGPNGETWTSRGAKPRWLAALVAEGKNPDDYRIKA